MPSLIKKLVSTQSFTLGLILAVAAAMLWPDLGTKTGPLHSGISSKLAVAIIFLIQGLSLPTRQILASASKFRLHLFCQSANYILAPLLMLAFLFVFGAWIHDGIEPGFTYLAILPTTISSAIVMTSNSGGDSSSALFSTTLSNILGVFLTPLLCSLLITNTSSQGLPLPSLIGKISMLVLLPIVLGQLLRPVVRGWANRSKALFKRTSNALILFIIYTSFCESVSEGVWAEAGSQTVLNTLFFALLFMLLFSAIVWWLCPLGAGNQPDRIAAFYCGSHKTLAAGVPMASILFASLPPDGATTLGFLILPLLCYHPVQLLLAGILTPYFARSASASRPNMKTSSQSNH